MLRFITPFTYLATAQLTSGVFTSINAATISANQLVLSSGGVRASVTLTAKSTWFFNVRLTESYSGASRSILYIADGATVQCGLAINTSGQLFAFRNAVSTVVGSASTYVFPTGSTNDLECKFVLNGASSTLEVRVGGAQVLSITGDLTQTANDTADVVWVGDVGSANGHTLTMAHVIVSDGDAGDGWDTFRGPQNVVAGVATANGNYTGWTASTGSAFQCIDEIPPNTSDYISASAAATKSTFVFPNAAAGTTAVNAVSVMHFAERDDATTRKFKTLLWDGSTDNLGGTEFTMGASFVYFTQLYGYNPYTGAAWGASTNFDAYEYGAEVTV